jgi:cell division topological specificity factor
MNLISLFGRRTSAPVARERLQVLLAHERAGTGQSELIGVLREEILTVIAKHVALDRDKVQVKMDRGNGVSTPGGRDRDPDARRPAGLDAGLNAARPALSGRVSPT